MAKLGRVHSIETMGTVDGPGTRLVVFMQGCPLRCKFCHNPDTWDFAGGSEMSVDEVLAAFRRNRAFYKKGGITVSGGEPLSQAAFVAELFEAAHAEPTGRIHTCLDTSGISYQKGSADQQKLLDHCDLVLLDIKHSDPASHLELCKGELKRVLAFGDELARRNISVIIRHVSVPGISDSVAELREVGRLIAAWDNVVGVDVLPYHTMGKAKYEQLGLAYPLEGVPAQDKSRVAELRREILVGRALERKRLGKA